MKKITDAVKKPARTERVIQIGEGGFLRGFADWMLQKLNDSGKWEGSIVIVQPLEHGKCDTLSEQDCLYTHVMRGLENGKPAVHTEIIDCVSRCINPYREFAAFRALALQPELRFIISNTTEAGIAYEPADKPTDAPPKSFPARLTILLYDRFRAGLPGFVLLPCELIEKNGEKLKEIILNYAAQWGLGEAFVRWVKQENVFCNTLVDRIVTGYPKDETIELGYEDKILDTSELFHLWVIEGNPQLERELPFAQVGLNVVWTEDELDKYRTRKVRILNGAHTALVPYAMLKGFDTVKSCMDDPNMLAYIKRCIYDEIIPTLDLPEQELRSYADEVLARFANPFIKHYLSSIALNSVSKFRVRVLPSILAYRERFGKTPPALMQAFAALLRFYQTDMANDDPQILEFLKNASIEEALAREEYWGLDLRFLADELKRYDL